MTRDLWLVPVLALYVTGAWLIASALLDARYWKRKR